MGFPLTQEQRNIVTDRGGELLVSAAAGSGKTRVLVERLLDRVTREGLDIDSFLVITYTRAAAAELRARIAQELTARLAESPRDRHLRRQTTLVYRAQISTIHSFCSQLLRENCHLLDLDGDFRLCDESEAQVLMVRVLDQLLEQRYESLEPDSPFAALTDTMAAGRDDSRLSEIVLDIHSRIQSHPAPSAWLREQKQKWELEGITDLGQTDWGALLLEEVRGLAHGHLDSMRRALELSLKDELLKVNYSGSLETTLDRLIQLQRAGSWDEAAACFPIPFPAVGRKRKRSAEQTALPEDVYARMLDLIKQNRDRCKKDMEKAAEQMGADSKALLEEIRQCRPAVRALMELVEDFQTAYQKEKRRRSLVDFSDLEHYSVALLTDDRGRPTPLAESWAARYAEVMVDEYQDTNLVQNVIFRAISRDGSTLFQVGDVKQSIYRFRLADPTIFLEKYERFLPGEQAAPGQPRKLVLSRNFRSRPQVLEGCNDFFRSVMSKQFGELDYTRDQALVSGAAFAGEPDHYRVELDGLDLSFLGDMEGEKDNKDLLEARFAARRIRELLTEPLQVQEGDGLRPLRPSDVMILLRSPGPVLHHYIRALNEESIPWTADERGDFFDSTEVNVALSILQIVDNPRQDVPLLAALRSPVYGFTGDKLAVLRAEAQGDFYSAVQGGAERGDEDCRAFLEELEQLRFGAGDRTCRQLIWHVYERTNLLGVFGAMDGGSQRQSNLLALYAFAGQLEEMGCRTLFQFLLRLERMRSTGAKLGSSGSGQEGEGVSIMSIHRSKGLEKPVVLVCGLTRRFNKDDMKRPVLFHPKLGVGPKGLDTRRMVEYPTVARMAVSRQLEREMMSETLRLLYVAMTRAREKLILTLALPEGAASLKRLGSDLSLPLLPRVLERQQNAGQWLLLHALTRPEAGGLRTLADVPELVDDAVGPAWDIRWISGEDLAEAGRAGGRYTDLPKEAAGDWQAVREKLSWRYPHIACTAIPSKLTATQIKGRPRDQEAAEDAVSVAPRSKEKSGVYRPDFITEKQGLTAAQRGSALHLAMEYLKLDGDLTFQGVEQQLEQLEREGFLSPAQRQAVDGTRIAAFFDHPVGKAVLSARECCREFKFSILVPAEEYYPGAGEEEVLLQGVVDLWFDDGEGVTILDFKSDRVTAGGERARAEVHRPQLDAYSRALSAILGRPIRRRILWFFAVDEAVEL